MQPSNNIVAQDFRNDDAVHLQHAEIENVENFENTERNGCKLGHRKMLPAE